MEHKTRLGPWGEEIAARCLELKGFEIVERNFRCRYGEIDIIAKNAEFLVFAEVKLRKSAKFGAAREFVDRRKQEKLSASAALWLEEHETELQPRFDVVEIYAPEGLRTKCPAVRLLEGAFDAEAYGV